MATIVNSTPAVADVINKSSLLQAEETAPEEEMISLEFKSTTYMNMDIRYVGDIKIVNLKRISVAISTPPTNKEGKVISPTPKRAIELAQDAGKWIATKEGCALLVAGFRGVDAYATKVALEAGNPVIAVVPMGLGNLYEGFKPETVAAMNKHIKEGRLLIISTNTCDEAKWTNEDSRNRNRFIAKVADAIFIPHLGGSWNRGLRKYSGGVMDLLYRAEEENVPVFLPAFKPGEHLLMGSLVHIFPKNISMLPDEGKSKDIFEAMIG